MDYPLSLSSASYESPVLSRLHLVSLRASILEGEKLALRCSTYYYPNPLDLSLFRAALDRFTRNILHRIIALSFFIDEFKELLEFYPKADCFGT